MNVNLEADEKNNKNKKRLLNLKKEMFEFGNRTIKKVDELRLGIKENKL